MTAIVGQGVEARDTVEHVRFIGFELTTLTSGDIDPALNTVRMFKRGFFGIRSIPNLPLYRQCRALSSESSLNLEKLVRATRCSTVRQSNWNSSR